MEQESGEEAALDVPLLLTATQAADLLGVSRGTLRAITKEHQLEPVSTGRRNFWRRAEIERLAGLPAKGNA